MSHHIQERVLKKHGIVITTVASTPTTRRTLKPSICAKPCASLSWRTRASFRCTVFTPTTLKTHTFDVIISFNIHDRESLRQHIVEDVQKRYPGWSVFTNLDIDMSD